MELEEEINPEKLEDFKAPDIDPLRKKKIKRYLTLAFILLFIIGFIIGLVFLLRYLLKKEKYEIFCKFYSIGNETIKIINEKVIKDKDNYDLLINGEKVSREALQKLNQGNNTVKFEFKDKFDTLYELFYGIDKLIEIDLSKMNPEAFSNITRIFSDCE